MNIPLVSTLAKWLQALLLAGVVAALSYFALDYFAPAWASEARALVGAGSRWSEEAVRRDPAGFLRFSRRRLEGQQQELTAALANLQHSLAPLLEEIAGREETLAKTSALLTEGRQVYRQALQANRMGQAAEPIRFAGRPYDLEGFKAQLALLFQERQSGEALLGHARQTRQRLTDRLYEMKLAKGKLEAALAELPGQLLLVESKVATGEADETIGRLRAAVEAATSGADQALAELAPLGTTKELLASHAAATGGSGGRQEEPAFAAFLQGAAN